MGVATSNSSSKIAAYLITAVLLIAGFFISKLFLPWYRWLEVDFAAIARKSQLQEAFVRKEYDVTVGWQPRGEGDPNPWVLLDQKPTWAEATGDPDTDETNFARRCVFINDVSGGTVSKFSLGGTYQHWFYSAKVWRLPPGSLPGKGRNRPILLYKDLSLEKVSIGEAQVFYEALRDPKRWERDEEDWTPPVKE